MCGIFGVIFLEKIDILDVIDRLRKLEYRGYDSCGVATNNGFVAKVVGDVSKLEEKVRKYNVKANIIIAHTRWATHGKVSEENAHPHLDCTGKIVIVHNGIIENYEELKSLLLSRGHKFRSETDSEIFAHWVEEGLKEGKSEIEIVKEIFEKFKGTYAVLVIFNDENKILAIKKESPLIIGLSSKEIYFSSDVHSFLDKTDRIIVLDDFEFAIAEIKGNRLELKVFDKNGKEVRKEIKKLKWVNLETSRKFEHFMIKEIYEQPVVAKILLDSLETEQRGRVTEFLNEIEKASKIVFIASGSSYHSSLLGAYFLRKLGFEAYAVLASEFNEWINYDKDTLIIAVSQSGETMDVILALKELKNKVKKILSVVNVPYSTIQRISDLSLEIKAGIEKCVAATKTYTNQVITFLFLAKELGLKVSLDKIPEKIKETIEMNENKIKKLAKELKNEKDLYILGRGVNYFASLEIALKLKEISYIHAEALPAGELKHGTLALIEPGVKVLALNPSWDRKIESNLKEVESRGGEIISLSERGDIKIEGEWYDYPIYSVIAGQLLTYYIAKEKNLPIDKPRNLAKSVTVI